VTQESRPLGDLEQSGGNWRLCFVRHLDHPIDKVWSAITLPEQRQQWFPTQIVGELRPGAKLSFEHPSIPTFDGEVLVCDPPRVLELRWGPDIILFEIEGAPGGSTLTLTHTFGEHGKAARDAAGWHECLDMLESVVSGETPTWAAGERWAEVHPSYMESFGPDASTVDRPGEMLDSGVNTERVNES
jgi:uncharacterized protein YndB with AHSA1/START domain